MAAVSSVKVIFEFSEPKSNVEVSFRKNMTRPELWEAIGRYENPQVIFWYIGANGFRKSGMKYYQEDLREIAKLSNDSHCSLYDLSAWAGLRKRQVSIESENPNVERINDFGIKGIRAIASSDFFRWLKGLRASDKAAYLNKAVLSREWIFLPSKEIPDVGLTVGEVFKNNCPALHPIYDKDCAKAYSAFQYIEGLYLIQKLVCEAILSGKSQTDIVFALANNEWHYYADDNSSFAEDVRGLLELRGIEDFRVNIEFCCFDYGKKTSFRPYNALGDIVVEMQKGDLM